MTQNILITGVTGFVGSNLVSYFDARDDVKLFGHARNPEKATTAFKGKRLSLLTNVTSDTLDSSGVDVVIHLAGIAHDLSNKFVDNDYFKVNFEDTARLYDEFLKSKARTFIYFSSIKAAVDSIETVLHETVASDPKTAYGKSKLKAELYIQEHAVGGKNYYILRPCMIHGPGNKGNLNLLYKFVNAGIPYPLGSFDNRRSFLNVDNLNFIIDRVIHKTMPDGIYNLADECALSTTEVVKTISYALGKKPRVLNLPKWAIRLLFKTLGKEKMLGKLVENMEVSNAKILSEINASLPLSVEEGLKRTIRSFHE